MASPAERDAYRERKMGDHIPSSAHVVANEPEIYTRAMVAEALNIDEPEIYMGTIEELEVYAEDLSINEPEVHLGYHGCRNFR